ncbi:T9SS type A sorting domain-containing protein, partial [candidate division TA06 bacterium]|nr:T9SS type A sorting domain-containing protein [candidate division TA06 bacterium]
LNSKFEIAIPFGSQKYELEASPANNDTVGLHMGIVDQGTFEEEGWWPTSLESTNETDPAYYGDLILAYVVPGVEEENDYVKLKTKNGKFELLQNKPNPFSHNTSIRFTLPASGFASLKIYDLTGRLVKTLHEGEMKKGLHTLTWDQRDNSGREVTTGVYFYRLQSRFGQAKEKEATRKLVVIKNTEK